jgi:hypothetical protein
MAIFRGKTGGEGGIRTLGTLIRGTHDFQSCTFNRSVTSPDWKFKDLRALPCVLNRQCLQNVSTGRIFDGLAHVSVNLTQQIIRGKEYVKGIFNESYRSSLRIPYSPNFPTW